MKQLASINALFLWIQLLYWARAFPSTAFYWEMIRETLNDIKEMLLILAIFLLAFGSAIYFLDTKGKVEGEPDDWQLVAEAFGPRLFDAILGQYLLGLGEFNFENFNDNPSKNMLWILFCSATFITQITIFNMLIAVMGETFQRVYEAKYVTSLKTNTEIVQEFKHLLPNRSFWKCPYAIVLKPKNYNDENNQKKESMMQTMKHKIDDSKNNLKEEMRIIKGQNHK